MSVQAKSTHFYIGLMSGTSVDGVDGTLLAIPDDYSGGALIMRASAYVPFPSELRTSLMALQTPGDHEIEREARAANALVHHYAECVSRILEQSKGDRKKVRAIGAHGQTIRHRPDLGFTRQINNPALLAEMTGIDVIADFRSRDIAAGGQGAPLVPAFHQAVFASSKETRVVVNIGGMANISVLHAGGTVAGYDTGPGNVLMDAWMMRQRGASYDVDGAWAASGKIIPALLAAMQQEPFFTLPPPKSTGRDLFHEAWLHAKVQDFVDARPEDVQATLAALTATTIADAIVVAAPDVAAVYVCGGGAHNTHLVRQLQMALHARKRKALVASTVELGVSPNHVEAMAFAWLAHRFCIRQPGNLPEVTGAKGARVLGAWHPA
ncbi:MAG: anhydro-N-acetylmuramic acid kinase [Oxalobacter sp.]|nr:MAG: anhydro-N-acetylmuramic acid kinase [Oxalobacter sp.]